MQSEGLYLHHKSTYAGPYLNPQKFSSHPPIQIPKNPRNFILRNNPITYQILHSLYFYSLKGVI